MRMITILILEPHLKLLKQDEVVNSCPAFDAKWEGGKAWEVGAS